MEKLKENLPMIIAIIVAGIILFLAYYLMFVHKNIYYTKIDNSKIEQTQDSDMKYQYKLTAYNSNGKEKEVEFKTSRELRQDAYLELEIMTGRGVVNWKEVQYDKLPKKVQEKY